MAIFCQMVRWTLLQIAGCKRIQNYILSCYTGIPRWGRIVELCQRDLAFIWLTKGQKPRRDAFYDFKSRKLTGEVLDEFNYQFLRRLKREGLVTLKELFNDGTKIEANANRYTFVWRGSINCHLAIRSTLFMQGTMHS